MDDSLSDSTPPPRLDNRISAAIIPPPSHIKLRLNETYLNIKSNKFHSENGLSAILSKPYSLALYPTKHERIINQNLYSFPTHQLIILVHGHGAHMNSTFLPLLADELAKLGKFVLRFDFRNCGDSETHTSVNRTINDDIDDLDSIVNFCLNKNNLYDDSFSTIFPYKVSLNSIVGHSKGVLIMFAWASTSNVKIPLLVNCSGRFDGEGFLKKLHRERYDDEEEEHSLKHLENVTLLVRRYGQLEEVPIHLNELLSIGNFNLKEVCSNLNKNVDNIVSCYGSKDQIVPLDALSKFSNLFNEFKINHYSEVIINADHNYYGLKDDNNVSKLSLCNGKVNYSMDLVKLLIKNYFTDEFQLKSFFRKNEMITPSINNYIILRKFKKIPRYPLPFKYSSVSNFRDIGGYYTKFPKLRVKTNCIYRSANMSGMTPMTKIFIENDLNIKKIFDLRSKNEILENGQIDNCNYIKNLPFNNNKPLSPESLPQQFKSLLISPFNYPDIYIKILRSSIESIKKFFNYIIDGSVNPENAIIFHCTAGKDRTGILTMLLLSILGVNDDTIAKEYQLTTFGLKTEEYLLKKIEVTSDLYYAILKDEHNEDTEPSTPDTQAVKTLIYNGQITPQTIFQSLVAADYEVMRLFIDQFNEIYTDTETFFRNELGFSFSDIHALRDALLE